VRWLVQFLLGIYRTVLSPAIHTLAGPGWGCRFEPSCSAYAQEAFRSGPLSWATTLTLKRVIRCHPGCPGGWDPLPKAP
jgi:putative membrane protein insertion efficiency factor